MPKLKSHTEESYEAYKAKMLTPFFKKHGVVVVGGDFDSAFVTLQQTKPELFETGHVDRGKK